MRRLLLFAAGLGKGKEPRTTMADPRNEIIHSGNLSAAEKASQLKICAAIASLMLLLAFWPMEGCSGDIVQADQFALNKAELDGLPEVLEICSDLVPGRGGDKEILDECSEPQMSSQSAKGE